MARGNAVMKAKRVHGPTPNAEFTLRVRMERCDRAGCDRPPLLTESQDGAIKRTCAFHVMHPGAIKQARIVDTGWKPPWM